MQRKLFCALAMAAALLPAGACHGELQEFFTDDRADWFDQTSAMGPITTLDFTGFPQFTVITDQYADLGVVFPEGNEFVLGESFETFPQDGWGLRAGETMTLEFDAPINAIASDFPGGLSMDLFRDGQLVGDSSDFGVSGAGQFGGLISNEPFDMAVLSAIGITFSIDDLHFATVPTPATFVLLPGLILFSRSRRRTRPGS